MCVTDIYVWWSRGPSHQPHAQHDRPSSGSGQRRAALAAGERVTLGPTTIVLPHSQALLVCSVRARAPAGGAHVGAAPCACTSFAWRLLCETAPGGAPSGAAQLQPHGVMALAALRRWAAQQRCHACTAHDHLHERAAEPLVALARLAPATPSLRSRLEIKRQHWHMAWLPC